MKVMWYQQLNKINEHGTNTSILVFSFARNFEYWWAENSFTKVQPGRIQNVNAIRDPLKLTGMELHFFFFAVRGMHDLFINNPAQPAVFTKFIHL